MACTVPPGKPDSIAHRSRMYCESDRSAARASRPETMAAAQPRTRADVSRSTPAMRLREVLKPFNDDLDVRPRRFVASTGSSRGSFGRVPILASGTPEVNSCCATISVPAALFRRVVRNAARPGSQRNECVRGPAVRKTVRHSRARSTAEGRTVRSEWCDRPID